jgi:antitoxin ParD1/3/4
MDTMEFSVPEHFRVFVQSRVDEGGFGSTSDYLQQLISADQQRHARSRLEAELQKGIESGPAEPMTAADWESVRNEVRNRIEARINKSA